MMLTDSSCLFLGQEITEGKTDQEGKGDDDPLGGCEQGPYEELKGCLFEILKDEDEPHQYGNADEDELVVIPESPQSHSSTLRPVILKISHGAVVCVNRSFRDNPTE